MTRDTNTSSGFFWHNKGEKNDMINLCIVDSNSQVMEKKLVTWIAQACTEQRSKQLHTESSKVQQNLLVLAQNWLCQAGVNSWEFTQRRLSCSPCLGAALAQNANQLRLCSQEGPCVSSCVKLVLDAEQSPVSSWIGLRMNSGSESLRF